LNTVPLNRLAANLDPGEMAQQVLAGAMPALRLIAVSGCKADMARGVSPDGTRYAPLRRPRPDGSGTPLRDKGLLMASVGAKLTAKELILTASHPAANVHQYGATIRPATAKMLALPLTAEAKRIGSPRKNNFPRPLFVYHARSGRSLFLAESTGGKLTLQYLLKSEVRVPARPYLGFSKATLEKMGRVVADRALDWVTRRFLADSAPLVESWGVSV